MKPTTRRESGALRSSGVAVYRSLCVLVPIRRQQQCGDAARLWESGKGFVLRPECVFGSQSLSVWMLFSMSLATFCEAFLSSCGLGEGESLIRSYQESAQYNAKN